MTVSVTECTPEGKPLSACSNPELLHTVKAINSYGMLRMHATNRLLGEVYDEVCSRGFGLYDYDDSSTEWEKSVGVDHSIAKGGQQLADTDHHECISCRHRYPEVFHVFPVNGPLTDAVKAGIDTEMRRLVAEAEAEQVAWRAEQAKNPPPPGLMIITGVCTVTSFPR